MLDLEDLKGVTAEPAEHHLVTRASRLCGGDGIGLGGEESTPRKPSRLQGVGPMGMPADDPLRQTQRSYFTVSLLHLVRGERLSR